MIKSSGKYMDMVLIIIAAIVFLFILPGLLAGIGAMAAVYIDGLNELPPFALKAASAAVGMLLISYCACRFLKADKGFIRWPARLTFIGVICLPFANGAQNAFRGVLPDDAPTTAGLANVQEALASLSLLLMQILPATLCTVSVILLAVGLTLRFRDRAH